MHASPPFRLVGAILALPPILLLYRASPTYAQGSEYCEAARLTPCVQLFGPGEAFYTDMDVVTDMVTADFNLDGHLDFVATKGSPSHHLLVYSGRGDGTFVGPVQIETGTTTPYWVATGDLDGDGAPDLVASPSAYGSVSVLFGDGAGRFPRRADLATGGSPRALAVSDLDGDGLDDLVVTDEIGRTASVVFGPVNTGPIAPLAFPIRGLPLRVLVTDVNGNGRPDVAILGGGGIDPDVLTILTDFSRTGPSGRQEVALPPGAESMDIASADLNGDGLPDFAVADANGDQCLVLLAKEEGGYGPAKGYPTSRLPFSIAAADVNRDGMPDLLLACHESSSVHCLLGTGDGTFVSQGDYCTDAGLSLLITGDFREDGWPDVVTASYLRRSIDVLLNTRVQIGTPFRVTATSGPATGRSSSQSGLLRLELPKGIAAADVDLASIRIEGKQLPGLQPFGPGITSDSQAPQVLLRFNPAELATLDPGNRPPELTGCLHEGRPFGGPILPRQVARSVRGSAGAAFRLEIRSLGPAIRFSIQGSVPDRWTLRIFDVRGVLVWSRIEHGAPSGAVVWNRTSLTGERVPSGIYFYRAEADLRTATGKLAVLR